MKRSICITLIITTSVCIVAMLSQAAKNKALSEQCAKARLETKARQETKMEPEANSRSGSSGERDSDTLVRNATYAVNRHLADVAGKSDDRSYMAEKLPGLLRAVKDLNVDELILVAEALPKSTTRELLMSLALEQDPAKVSRSGKLLEGMSVDEKLSILARYDPAAALREFPPMSLEDFQGDYGPSRFGSKLVYAANLLEENLEQGLQAFVDIQMEAQKLSPTETGQFPSSIKSSFTPIPEKCIPELITAIKKPEYAAIRTDFIELILLNTISTQGVAAMAERSSLMDLTPEEVDRCIDTSRAVELLRNDPAATVAWISKMSPERVPSLVTEWANLDLVGATTWLGQQEPSPLRDQAIAQFALSASKLDSEAATQWANEIQDMQLREQTLKGMPKN